MELKHFIVTVILNKVAKRGAPELCLMPINGVCTAPHGRHHSVLVLATDAKSAAWALQSREFFVARVEEAHLYV